MNGCRYDIRKVLLTADAVGGVWTFALDLARGLSAAGIEVTLATMGPPPDETQAREARAIRSVNLVSRACALEWMDDPWSDVDSAGEWLLELEDVVRPDIVHHNGYAHGVLAFHAPVLITAHSCVLSWWRAVKHENAPATWDEYRRRTRMGLLAAELVVAPTHAMLSDLLDCHGALERVDVIHNGRRIAPRISPKEPLVLSAGRIWDEAKNVRALASVATDLPWDVYVAGESRDRDEDFGAIRPLGRLGAEALHAWMARASIYALPARYEPFGLSALEAAHARCALVLGDIPSLREVWRDSALFVPPDDHQALRDAISHLIQNVGERQRLADAAQQRAAAFPPERMTERYLTAYLDAISTRSKRRSAIQEPACAS